MTILGVAQQEFFQILLNAKHLFALRTFCFTSID
jgi:hypothetical protein